MKIALLILVSMTTSIAFGQDVWINRDAVNGPKRAACAGFELNGEAFVATGVNVSEFKRKLYSYDLDQNDWDNEIALGGTTGSGLERGSAVGFSAAGYGFIALGSGAISNLKDLWRYDPESESWSQMADFAGSARNGAIAFSIDDICFVGLGQDDGGVKDDFYKYDPETNNWTELDDFEGEKRKEAVGFTMGGKGYVGTGKGEDSYLTDFWEYNPTNDNWSQKADFPGTPRFGAVGCGAFPTAFIMLGEDNSFDYKEDVWEYNYFGDVWTQRANYLGGTRTQANAFVVDDRIFVGLGYNGIYHDDFYEYERILSTKSFQISNPFLISPNPASQYFTLSFVNTINFENINIIVYAKNGADISSQFSFETGSNNSINVSVNGTLSTGNYIIALYENQNYLGAENIILQ